MKGAETRGDSRAGDALPNHAVKLEAQENSLLESPRTAEACDECEVAASGTPILGDSIAEVQPQVEGGANNNANEAPEEPRKLTGAAEPTRGGSPLRLPPPGVPLFAGKSELDELALSHQLLRARLSADRRRLDSKVELLVELKSQEEYNRKRSNSREDSMRFWMKKADAQRRQLVLLKEQCETGNLDKLTTLENRIKEKENILRELKGVGDGLERIRQQQGKAMQHVESKNRDLPEKAQKLQNDLKMLKADNIVLRNENHRNEQELKKIHEVCVDYEGKLRRYLQALKCKTGNPGGNQLSLETPELRLAVRIRELFP
ncbi:hypothetical protein CSUI_008009 [Cystoisospora suis]|uniref:Uncharacterized protein n=1 Tax=Cystoisospora suis TaxID=483139 RepID=A0A2C6KP64_9APIC|nr:hypothetical protein CSUI_008009 [Cystoisospora suis]